MAGTLSATTAPGTTSSPPFVGNSQLAATLLEKYAKAAGLAGIGALDVAQAIPKFSRSSALSGSGLYLPTTKQIYASIANPVGTGTLSGIMGPMMPTTYSVVGAYTYPIPWEWAHYIDWIILGGGAGGQSGGAYNSGPGQGGHNGEWLYGTLDLNGVPPSTLNITGVVAAGGSGGPVGTGNPGNDGGDTTLNVAGVGSVAAAGGNAPSGFGQVYNGMSPGTIYVNGRPYVGGAEQTVRGADGFAPGGGGSGGLQDVYIYGKKGGAGARGQAWFFAY